jgi:hypothetical protein
MNDFLLAFTLQKYAESSALAMLLKEKATSPQNKKDKWMVSPK